MFGFGANIELSKRIPAGAGLGGGSSDAAAALRGANSLWRLGFSRLQLMEIAAELGSDVPFFVEAEFGRLPRSRRTGRTDRTDWPLSFGSGASTGISFHADCLSTLSCAEEESFGNGDT